LPFTKDTDSADLKIDANLTDKDRLNGRFSWARPITFQAPIFGAAGGPAQSAFEGTGTQKSYSAGINYVRVFSSTLISEFRFGAAHYHNEAQNSDYGTTASTAIGVPGVNVSQFTSGLVGVVINGGFNGTNPLVGYSASVPWVRAETNIDVVNSWTKTLSKHTIKWGMDLRRLRDDLLQTQTFSPRGLYTFSEAQTSIPGAKTGFGNDLASFLLDVPSQAGRDLAVYFPAYRAWQFFMFAQDKWAVTPKLTVDLGLRWEYYPAGTPQFNGGFSNYNPIDNTLVIAGVGKNPANLGMVSRKKNFAPRVGAAYRLTEKTVIRAGFGISYTPFPDNTYAYNFPIKQNNAFNPIGTGFGPAVLSNGQPATFQAGFPAPTPAVIPSNGILTNPDVNQAYIVVNTNFKNPYVESWNFAIQQSLPKHFTLDLAYVGNHGVDSVVAPNINAAPVVGLGAKGQPEFGFGGRTASTTLYFQGYSTSYNGLQAKLDRRFTGGLSITTAYTFAKGMGFQRGDDGGLNYYINLHRNYARNDYDRTHTFVQSYLWELPFGEGRHWMSSANRGVTMALGGWQVAGILTLMTGIPMDITYTAANLLAPGNMQSPDQVAPVQILHGINNGNPWFSTSSFVAPTGLNFGTVGRNSVSGPGFFSMDCSLFKTFRVTERVHVELRGEAFNVSNTPQFSNPNSTLGNSSFGFVTGIVGGTSGRNLQLGAKLMF
jgi:hypothetical protein